MEVLRSIKKFASEERTAIICDGNTLGYRELYKYSEAFGSYLVEKYSNSKKPILIYGNKENLIIVCMMAALKSGRAYIPIDTTYPKERVEAIQEEVKADVLIDFSKGNTFHDIKVINEESLIKIIKEYDGKLCDEDNWIKDEDNAYILFTSGSTGKPKGVQISKKNIDTFVEWFKKYMNLDDRNGRILNQVSYSFDVSVMPIYLGLITGKTLISLSRDTLNDFKRLFNTLEMSNLEYWISTPALAEICVKDESFNRKLMPNIKQMFFAGEVLTKKLSKELFLRFGDNIRLINGYGPTEGTVLLSAIDIDKNMIEDSRSLPIGHPIDSGILKVVNSKGEEVKDGEKGELIALGNNISKGYYNNEELTNKSFFNCEVNGKKLRGYKTGDVVSFDNGVLYYYGRMDFQIKLNGYRIEIEDIENNLRKVTNVKNCVVLPIKNDENKVMYLTAFVTLNSESELSNLKTGIKIKKELGELIPSYMVPRNIKIIKKFPTNVNGKIDRKRLMEEI